MWAVAADPLPAVGVGNRVAAAAAGRELVAVPWVEGGLIVDGCVWAGIPSWRRGHPSRPVIAATRRRRLHGAPLQLRLVRAQTASRRRSGAARRRSRWRRAVVHPAVHLAAAPGRCTAPPPSCPPEPLSRLPPSPLDRLLPSPSCATHPHLAPETDRRAAAPWARVVVSVPPGLPFIPWRTACSSLNLSLAPSPPHVSCLFFSLVWVHDGRVFSFPRHRRWAWCSATRWWAPPSLASSSPSRRASGRVGRATEVAPGRAGWTCWSGRAGVVVGACG